MRLFLFLMLVLSMISSVNSTHIVGGEVYYDCLGGNNYRITVKVYRDCSSTANAPFDDPLPLTIYDGANNLFTVIDIPLVVPVNLPTVSNNPCLIPPPQCIEMATYITIVNLPPTPGGYTIVYQRCCRNSTILNLLNPSSVGATFFIRIADPSIVGCQSSPRFSSLPPLVICESDNFTFNHSATDPDGDSLVYSFYTPYEGGTTGAPSPNPSDPPPYVPLAWQVGFSQTNQINGTPPLTIDPVTGVLTCMPNVLGIYVYAVRVQEFRGGIFLSEALREFQINVVPCIISISSIIVPQSAVQLCSGLTLDFTNNSINATNYLWDFGDTSTTSDVSSLMNPSYIYPDTGTYYVTLIANPGTVCADTTIVPFSVHLPLSIAFDQPVAQCITTNSFDLLAYGNITSNANVSWSLPSANTPFLSGNPVGNISYADSGKYIATATVTEFGCTETYSDTLIVYPMPLVDFSYPDVLACEPYTIQFSDSSLSWSPIYYSWSFGDGDSSHAQNPVHTYYDTGYFNLSLTIWIDTICITTQTMVVDSAIHVFISPDAAINVTPRYQSILTPTVEVFNIVQVPIVDQIIYFDDGDSTLLDYAPHTYTDTGWYNVTQWVINQFGCTDTAVVPIYIVPEESVYVPNAFTPNGDGTNEIFFPVIRDVRCYEFTIFNRWGEIIYVITDPLKGWDGTLNNKKAKTDTYVYLLRYMDQQYNWHDKRGHFSLLR